MHRVSPKYIHTLGIVIKAMLIKIHSIFKAELSAINVGIHFLEDTLYIALSFMVL